jgi:CheY-like chemotaxis protein
MPSRVVCDFEADVTLPEMDSADLRTMRILVDTENIVLADDELKQSIGIENVIDVVRDVSSGVEPSESEVVSIAFRTGGATDVVSIESRADDLVQFQGALYQQALGDTPCGLEHDGNGDRRELPGEQFRLSVTASKLRFVSEADDTARITISREAILEFRALSDGNGDEQRLAVLLISERNDELRKTVVQLPSPRHLNLFGRYLKSELQLSEDSTEAASDRSGAIELLLVDDDPQDLHATEMFLKRRPEQFSIEMAPGGEAGLRVLEAASSIDCIVSDFRMPGMDGIEFLRTVRDRHPKVPFILYTGKGSEDVMRRAILDDVTDYVEKGVGAEQYDTLAERINKAIQQPTGRRHQK